MIITLIIPFSRCVAHLRAVLLYSTDLLRLSSHLRALLYLWPINYIGSLICLEGISCSYVNGKIFCTSSCALKVLLLLLLFDVPAVPVKSFPFRKDSKL